MGRGGNGEPPLDGHRRNILGPGHTHVGIGLAVVGGDLTMTQQFVNRYVRLRELPEAIPSRSIAVECEVLQKEFGPYYCALFYEGVPRPRTVEELNQTYAYTDMDGEQCGKTPPWEMGLDRARRRFRFSMAFRNRGPGYLPPALVGRPPVRGLPHEPFPGGALQIDTKFGIPCAGWVFRRE